MATVIYNGQEHSTETEIGKQALAFERASNYRPDAPENQYPRWLYRAYKGADGIVRADSGKGPERRFYKDDADFQAALDKDQAFNDSCRRLIGQGPDGKTLPLEQCRKIHEQCLAEGWFDSAVDAVEYIRGLEVQVAVAAAEMAYRDRNMSEKAKAEFKAADAATPNILPDMPEAPLHKGAKDVVRTTGKIDKRSKAYRDSIKQAS